MASIRQTQGNIHDAISRRFEGLSPTLRRAASFVLEHPEDVATRSLRHIARTADLTPTTLSRLARAVGCDSYDALRDLCRDEIRRGRSLFAEKALRLVEADSETDAGASETFLVQQAAASMSNIQQLLETIEPERMQVTAQALATADRVFLIGAMSAAPFFGYAHYLAGMALPNWHMIDWEKPDAGGILVDICENDIVLVMTFAPYAAKTVRAARALSEDGARLVVITDVAQSPVAGIARDLFLISTDSPQFFPSHVAVLVVLESLMGMVVRETGKSAQRRIAAVEQRTYALGDYWRE